MTNYAQGERSDIEDHGIQSWTIRKGIHQEL